MSCFHPNIMSYCPNGFSDHFGKVYNKDGSLRKWQFLEAGYQTIVDEQLYFQGVKSGVLYPANDFSDINEDGEYRYSLLVPCQQCAGCRIDYSKKWADRIVMEQLESPPNSCFFVTLTYNDDSLREHLTGHYYETIVDGEPVDIAAASLCKKDFQDFNKRLRKYFSDHYHHEGIRFFMSGEYGSKFKRPHYHVCYFNLPIQDLQVYSHNFRGDTLYTSPTLDKLWGKGYVVIGELNWECAAYTARYVVKKFKGKESADHYEQMGNVISEFSLSSRRPGIAAGYFDKHMEQIYRQDAIQLPSTQDRDGRTSVPRYFDKLLERYLEQHPDCSINLEKIKSDRRKFAEQSTYNRRILSGLFDKEYFRMKEESFNNSFKTLKRLLD